jgi:hypothetical protein
MKALCQESEGEERSLTEHRPPPSLHPAREPSSATSNSASYLGSPAEMVSRGASEAAYDCAGSTVLRQVPGSHLWPSASRVLSSAKGLKTTKFHFLVCI